MKNKKWIIQVFLWSFLLSIIFSYSTNVISNYSNIFVTCLIIVLVISIGILFDMVGAASLTSKEATFHAMSSKKIKGARVAILIIKNNVRVSSICNDIIGDICGIISGGLGAVLAITLAKLFDIQVMLTTIIISATISSLTVGGKALFKNIAIKNADKITYSFAKIISPFIKNKK